MDIETEVERLNYDTNEGIGRRAADAVFEGGGTTAEAGLHILLGRFVSAVAKIGDSLERIAVALEERK